MLTCQKHVFVLRLASRPLGGGHSASLLVNAQERIVGHVKLGGERQKNSDILDFLRHGHESVPGARSQTTRGKDARLSVHHNRVGQ